MSQQLQISSLFSAFALVCLCLFARVGVHGDDASLAGNGPVIELMSAVSAKG